MLFARWPGGDGGDIYTLNADGTGLSNLTNTSSFEQTPAWSPDGTKIAFSGGTTHSSLFDHEISVVNAADGSGRTRLTFNSAFDRDPDWAVLVPRAVGPPTSKAQCKKGGWKRFNVPRRFRNQGDCIQFVNTGT